MNDEKYTPEVGEWLKAREVDPLDSQTTARQVSARLHQVPQRGRWWPIPRLRRGASSGAPEDPGDHLSQGGLEP